MKILQVSNKPPYPPRDGGSLAMFNLARSLVKLGHEITVLTMFTRKHRLTVEQHKEFSKTMNVHTVYVDTAIKWPALILNVLFSDLPYNAVRFYSKSYAHELVRVLKSESFDLVQLEGLYVTPYINLIRKNSSARIVLRAHNVEHEIWERVAHEERNRYRRKYFEMLAGRIRRFEFGIINRYDMLVPITERDLNKFNSMGNSKPSHVSPAGVEVQPVMGDSGIQRTFSLYYLGSLDWIPNQEGLTWFARSVFPRLRKNYPDLKLHVAGRNAPMSLVRKIVHSGIVFHGEIDDAVAFSNEHSVLVAPTFSGSGMRLKILEAMALGKPVITTTIGAEGINAVSGEQLIIADDEESFYTAVVNLMNNPDFCKSIGQQAWELVFKNYNNIDIASSLAEFYNNHLT